MCCVCEGVVLCVSVCVCLSGEGVVCVCCVCEGVVCVREATVRLFAVAMTWKHALACMSTLVFGYVPLVYL